MPIPYPELMESSGTPRTNRIRRPYHFQLPHPSFFQDPTRALLEFLGVVRGVSAHSPLSSSPSSSHSLDNESSSPPPSRRNVTIRDSSSSDVGTSRGEPEVSINISTVRETEETRIASREQNNNTNNNNSVNAINDINNNIGINSINNTNNFNISNDTNSINGIHAINNNDAINSLPIDTGTNLHLSSNNNNNNNNNNERDSQRYDMQQLARWIEQVLPFLVLLLMVFIRQHIEGFLVTLWISAVMIKSNDILRKQTALKGERKNLTIITIGLGMLLQITGIYWWFKEEDLFRPLLLLAPKEIPKFWHSIFIILVNDTLIRQGAMVLKCGLLLHYKKARGRQYHRQGQLLTLVEYFVLLYRALLPAPVWYRFFLNKEYGSLFSSLTTGLYLTFKLTSVLEKLQTFLAALKALAGREVQYGSYATAEEVIIAGDLCAICQEKMHAPILLSCKHLFCEDCVSEWFDREKTCPLCRAVVKPTEFQSFSDGSTSLLYQVF